MKIAVCHFVNLDEQLEETDHDTHALTCHVSPDTLAASMGLITTSQPLDREMIASYNITIAAIDGGTPPLTGVGTVIINISDENDNAPSFTEASYETTIPENSMNGSFVAALLASDEDSGSNGQVSYSIIGGLTAFEIDSTSGMVTVRNSTALDFETTQIIHVQIEAQDMGTLRLSTQTLVCCKPSLLSHTENCFCYTS